MTERAIPQVGMYELTNPDPLRRHTVRSIATAAGCSWATVHRLRSGKITAVSEPIAARIAQACGMGLADMFRATGRVAWN